MKMNMMMKTVLALTFFSIVCVNAQKNFRSSRSLRSENVLNIWNDMTESLSGIDEKLGKALNTVNEVAGKVKAFDIWSSFKELSVFAKQVSSENEKLNIGTIQKNIWNSVLDSKVTGTVEPKKERAVVRPFCAKDFLALEQSFKNWDEHVPCYFKEEALSVDLLLYYSRDIHAPEAENIHKRMKTLIKTIKSKKWMKTCFNEITLIDAHLNERRDVYKPSEIESNKMWNNGPNEQFEIVIDDLTSMEKYDLFYYMEPDSVPVTSYWLENLWEEVETKAPFAVLGSKYIGDRWDEFRDQLPLGMQHHLNGNAVYNLSHPLITALVDDLMNPESEYTSSYDLRLAEMLLEGPDAVGMDGLENVGYKVSKVIGNYAATIKIKGSYPSGISLVHGAKEFEAWPQDESVTLVVSAWDLNEARDFVENLPKDLPFTNVVVMSLDETQAQALNANEDKTVRAFSRVAENDASWDICEAPVETEWFMMTNTYHRAVEDFGLPSVKATGSSVQAVMQYLKEDSIVCDFSCKERIHTSRMNYGTGKKYDMDVHPMRLVFNTKQRNEFCRQHEESSAQAPSANDFVAWLVSNDKHNEKYSWSNMEKYGYLDQFKVEDKSYGETSKIGRFLGANETMAPTQAPTSPSLPNVCKKTKQKWLCNKLSFCKWKKQRCQYKGPVSTKSPTVGVPTLSPTTGVPTPFSCSNLSKKGCIKSNKCKYVKKQKKCVAKATKSPTVQTTSAPTLEPATNAPTTTNTCFTSLLPNICKKRNGCWWNPTTKKCRQDTCNSRNTLRLCKKEGGCKWNPLVNKCGERSCSTLKKKGVCTKSFHCKWSGNSCVAK